MNNCFTYLSFCCNQQFQNHTKLNVQISFKKYKTTFIHCWLLPGDLRRNSKKFQFYVKKNKMTKFFSLFPYALGLKIKLHSFILQIFFFILLLLSTAEKKKPMKLKKIEISLIIITVKLTQFINMISEKTFSFLFKFFFVCVFVL